VAARPRPLSRRRLAIGGAGLFAIGVLNGSLTSGTGLFVTLWLVRWFGLDYGRAVAYTLVLVGLSGPAPVPSPSASRARSPGAGCRCC
jgi:hypothetical protein